MLPKRPVIGCTTYLKIADQDPPIDLFGLMPAYTQAVTAAGGIPFLIPHGLSEDDMLALLERMDGLLLPGGGDVAPALYNGALDTTMWGIDHERDRMEFFLVRAAVAANKPLLAICRGCQVINVALGGTLWGDIASQKPAAIRHDYYRTHSRNHLAHIVEVEVGSTLARYLGKTSTWVNSLHHQGIRDLATPLTVTAVAPDGLIEAVEVSGHPFAVAVQWHPECLIEDDPAMLALFKGLVETAASY